MMRMKYLWLILFIPVLGLSQTSYQGQVDSSDDNPPGLEEAWKYKFSNQESYQSPYGNLENEIPESYGNSPSRVTVSGKGHATNCRPKEYRETFELPPEAFADYCEARMGKSYKEEKAKAAMRHYENMANQFFGTQGNHQGQQQIPNHGSHSAVAQPQSFGFGSMMDPNKYIINSSADLAGALEAAKKGKEIHDHRNGQRGCSKCHSNKMAAKKHQELKDVQKFQNENLKRYEDSLKQMMSNLSSGSSPQRHKVRRSSRSSGSSKGKSRGRRPASSSSAFSSPMKKPDLGYSHSQSKGSSVLINYKPNKDKNGTTHFEWGVNNK